MAIYGAGDSTGGRLASLRRRPTAGFGTAPTPSITPPPMTPQTPPVPQPGTPGGTQPFTATQNLLGTQVNPGTFTPSDQATQARQLTGQGLASLYNAPNRQQIAENLYNTLAERETAQSAGKLRGLGQRAAALGRLGSGMVSEEAGDIFGERASNLAAIRAGLSSETAGQELSDRLARLQATQGVGGQLFGEDLARGGFEQSLRDETRGERGFQVGEEQRGIENALRRRLTEEDLLDRAYGRDLSRLNLQGQYGFGGTSPLELDIADQYGTESGNLFGSAADLIRQRNAARPGSPMEAAIGPAPASPTTRLRKPRSWPEYGF